MDGMRQLLSRYTASKLHALREDANFMRETTSGSRFVGVIVMALEL